MSAKVETNPHRVRSRVLFDQPLLPGTMDKLAIDNFAGGGGASCAIEEALGRPVDIAINHDKDALSMHEANHPQTRHIPSDIFEVDVKAVVDGRQVGLMWMSPDCTDFSRAKGDAPLRLPSKKRRALAHIGLRWAGQASPERIFLENVQEFTDWTRLVAKRDKATGRVMKVDPTGKNKNGIPAEKGEYVPLHQQMLGRDNRRRVPKFDKATGRMMKKDGTVAEKGEYVPKKDRLMIRCRKGLGMSFRKFVRGLQDHGYTVEWRMLCAADYGTATIRTRLFLIARCDHQEIVWPARTHAPRNSVEVARKLLEPWVPAAKFIDFSIPMFSIFGTKEHAKEWAKFHGVGVPQRPLKPASLSRIARGTWKFVIDNQNPYFVAVPGEIWSPFNYSTTHGGHDYRCWSPDSSLTTITCANRGEVAIASAVMVPRYGEREGQEPRCRDPKDALASVTTDDNGSYLVTAQLAANLLTHNVTGFSEGNSGDGRPLTDPIASQTNKGAQHSLLSVCFDQANGGKIHGRAAHDPLATILTESRGHTGLLGVSLGQSNFGDKPFSEAVDPLRTVVSGGTHHYVAGMSINRDFGKSVGSPAGDPLGTITAGGLGKASLVAAFLKEYYGNDDDGSDVSKPLRTTTCFDRHGLVCVRIDKVTEIPTAWGTLAIVEPGEYIVTDILMRMLQPRELYLCQGFRPEYIIDHGHDGRKFTKSQQVHMCGNSVCPPVVRALIRANCADMIVRKVPDRAGVAA